MDKLHGLISAMIHLRHAMLNLEMDPDGARLTLDVDSYEALERAVLKSDALAGGVGPKDGRTKIAGITIERALRVAWPVKFVA